MRGEVGAGGETQAGLSSGALPATRPPAPGGTSLFPPCLLLHRAHRTSLQGVSIQTRW